MNVDKEGLLVIGEGMIAEVRVQKIVKYHFVNQNRCMGAFYLSHHKLLMNEFRHILNEKCTGCEMNDCNQFGHELCLLASVQEQVNICFEQAYSRVNWFF